MTRPRGNPSPRQWLRYALGGRLPQARREWVRHDLTDAGWRWRVLARVGVQLAAPLVLVVVLAVVALDALSGVLLVLLLLTSSIGISAMVADQLRDRRLHQHGLPVPRDADRDFRERRPY